MSRLINVMGWNYLAIHVERSPCSHSIVSGVHECPWCLRALRSASKAHGTRHTLSGHMDTRSTTSSTAQARNFPKSRFFWQTSLNHSSTRG